MMRYPFETPTVNITYSCWFRSNFSNVNQTPFTYSVNGNNEMLLFTNSNTQIAPHPKGVSVAVNTTSMTNVWVNFTWSRAAATGINRFYRDGVFLSQYDKKLILEYKPLFIDSDVEEWANIIDEMLQNEQNILLDAPQRISYL